MDLQILRDLLARWAVQIIRGRRSKLGYVLPAYSEYIGGGAYGTQAPIDIDPQIELIDRCFRRLPVNQRVILWVHYVEPGAVKTKHEPGQGRAYHARKTFAEESLLAIYTEEESSTNTAAISAAT